MSDNQQVMKPVVVAFLTGFIDAQCAFADTTAAGIDRDYPHMPLDLEIRTAYAEGAYDGGQCEPDYWRVCKMIPDGMTTEQALTRAAVLSDEWVWQP